MLVLNYKVYGETLGGKYCVSRTLIMNKTKKVLTINICILYFEEMKILELKLFVSIFQ